MLLLRDMEDLKGRELRGKIKDLIFWCDSSVADPEVIDAELFADFVDGMCRVVGNYGVIDGVAVEPALRRIIDLQESRRDTTTKLWLTLARFRSMISLEDDRREEALNAALESAPVGSALWAESVLAKAWYLNDISRYGDALRIVGRLRQAIPQELYDGYYACGADTMAGVALFTSFRDLGAARQKLTRACTFSKEADDDVQLRRWTATAHHYLGRIAEVDRDYPEALARYVQGHALQTRCPEELQSIAFIHLRMSEPLIALGYFDEAEDHLRTAAQVCSDYADYSSGRLQVQLGFATLDVAKGRTGFALQTIDATRNEARAIGYWRGELLCLGYKCAVLLRTRSVLRLVPVLLDIIMTMRGGELGRGNAARLLLRLPTVLGVAVRRMSFRPSRPLQPATTTGCPCRVHTPADAVAAGGPSA
ncbi:hypothetical protein GCM10017691_63690 [Pseudonocardia petroleophila]